MKYKDYSLQDYLDDLASKKPAPGGGSAAALTGALGVALISMVANYSKGKGTTGTAEKKIRETLKKSERIRRRLLQLVDLDAQAYLKVVAARKGSKRVKDAARKKARDVPMEVCRLCYDALDLAPPLVQYGNPYLLSDVKCAVETLLAAFNAAMVNVEINQ